MESEKVKEIKKALEEGQFNTINHHQKEGKPIKISFADILTLINELENEIKETSSYARGYADGIKNTYEAMLPQKLENFAERLIDKKIKLGERFNIYDIDETLKEFIK